MNTTTKYLLALLAGVALSATVHAQDSVQGTNNASADSGSQSGAMAGSSLTQYNNAGGYLHQSVSAQVPLSIAGYGSFAQNNCVNSEGAGATTKIFSFNFLKGKPDIHCYQGVLSDQFGRESQLAQGRGLVHEAEDLRSMGVWATCLSDPNVRQMCLDMGKIRQVGNRYVPVPSQEIPSHLNDPNWRGVAKGPTPDSQASTAAPANPAQQATAPTGWWAAAPWVQASKQ